MLHFISLMKQVKDTMHKVFWSLLRQQLNNDPPEYSQAMILLTEIREVCTVTKYSINFNLYFFY